MLFLIILSHSGGFVIPFFVWVEIASLVFISLSGVGFPVSIA